jgi:competence protein ComEA
MSLRTFTRSLALTLVTLLGTTSVVAAAEPPAPALQAQANPGAELPGRPRAVVEGKVNLNTASAAELEVVPGIGPATSARILAYRKVRPFGQRNHIMRIKGVGKKTFAKIKDYLIVEGETTLTKMVK